MLLPFSFCTQEEVKSNANSLLAMLGVEGSEKLLARVGSMVAGAAQAMEAVMEQLEIKPDEQQAALAELLTVVERRVPQIVTALLIEALLPGLQRRAVRHFRHKRRESEDVALDLSQTMVANILDALNGRRPDGNAGAWVARICHNVYADHVRKRDRGRQVLSNIEKAARSMRRL
jgi:sigma-70-like protein